MGYRYDIAIRSTHKYAVKACGDVARVVDLPDGGVALVVIDGQGSGPSARVLARDVGLRLAQLLEAGCTADVAARAANQALVAGRSGQVSASFDVVRAGSDGVFEIARFSTNLLRVFNGASWVSLGEQSESGGRSGSADPDRFRCSLADASMVLVATDGAAGSAFDSWLATASSTDTIGDLATSAFDAVLASANGRPKDDLTIALIRRSEILADQRFEQVDFRRDVR